MSLGWRAHRYKLPDCFLSFWDWRRPSEMSERRSKEQPEAAPLVERMIDVDDARLHAMAFGSGEPVIVVHGGPGFDSLHMLPLKDLSDEFRVIFYDQRATGRSTGEVSKQTMTVDRFVEDLEAIRRHFNLQRMHLVGHSWGGGLAMHYAVKYPQRLKSFTVMGCGGASSESIPEMVETIQQRTLPDDAAAIQEIAESPEFAAGDELTLQRHLRLALRPFFHDPEKIDDMDLHLLPATATNQARVAELISVDLGDFDLYDRLEVIECPSLIVHGDFDPDPLSGAERLQRTLPHAQLVVLEKCGHFMFVERRAETISALREFLRNVAG